jgi:hypothetical protein
MVLRCLIEDTSESFLSSRAGSRRKKTLEQFFCPRHKKPPLDVFEIDKGLSCSGRGLVICKRNADREMIRVQGNFGRPAYRERQVRRN